MDRYLQEKEVLEGMITWLKTRIKEAGTESGAYHDMLESLEWELKTVEERIKDEEANASLVH